MRRVPYVFFVRLLPMVRRTDPSADDWRNVEDAKKRKQIQDRLAQRARRQRLREAKNHARHGDEQDETRRASAAQNGNNSQALVSSSSEPRLVLDESFDLDMVPLLADSVDCLPSSSPASSSSSAEWTPFNIGNIAMCTAFPRASQVSIPLLSPASQPQYPLNLYGALYINGQVLGIPCSTVVPAKSSPVGPEIPLPLHPTALQLMTIHSRWIDRFPFPKMRNSLISLSGVIDDEELMRDLALMPSFEIVSGRMPWDPRAWKIQKPFAEKWGYLFFGSV